MYSSFDASRSIEFGCADNAQPGNPKPRFFRLSEDSAVINRYGFNSLGHGYTLARLKFRIISFSRSHPSYFPSPFPLNPLPPPGLPRSLRPGQILAVNLGKNKTSAADSNEDYVQGVRTLGPYADVVVVNVSSPNTPGLRALQGREVLQKLLSDVVGERDRIACGTGLPKIVVKVACDLGEAELGDVATAVRGSGVEGVIVSNTTVRREELGLRSGKCLPHSNNSITTCYSSSQLLIHSANQDQVGGLSGKPLFPYALSALKTLRPLLPPNIPIIGCGGIWTSSDAISMANAGASLVQLYTSFGYRGVGTARLLKDEISQSLSGATWKQLIGNDWEAQAMGWDEKRLELESEKVRKEAADLGEILRKAWEEDDLKRLVEAAEKALHEGKSGARDNAMGSEVVPEEQKELVRGLVEGLVQRAAEEPPVRGMIEGSGEVRDQREGVPEVLEAVVNEPVVHVRPVVVDVVDDGRREDQWTQTVRSGQRRLV